MLNFSYSFAAKPTGTVDSIIAVALGLIAATSCTTDSTLPVSKQLVLGL